MAVSPDRVGFDRIDDVIAHQAHWLDDWASAAQGWISSAVQFGGRAGQVSKDILNGVWLGHPLHPVLTDVSIGAWLVSLVLDLLQLERAADATLGMGVVAAIPTALSGAADWADTSETPRRVGFVHGLLNSTALALYLMSLRARSTGNRSFGIGLSASGFALTSVSAWLGGELVYRLGTNVNRAAWEPAVTEFQAVSDAASLQDGKLTSATLDVEGQRLSLVLLKRGGEIFALHGVCSHSGGALADGRLTDNGCVECPLHASQFGLRDGRVRQGPATAPVPVYEARVRSGRVEVRSVNHSNT